MAKRFDEATYQRRVKPIIERWFADRTKAELEAMAGDRIALTAIKRIDEVVNDAHLRARQMFVQVPFGPVDVKVFGSPLKLSKVHWVRPEIVVEVTYLTWTEDNLDRWLTNPSILVPGTKMFFKLDDPQARADIIAYLKELK